MVEPLAIDNVVLDVPDVAAAADWYKARTGMSVVVLTDDVAVLHTTRPGPGVVLRRRSEPGRVGTFWIEVANAHEVADSLGSNPFSTATGFCVEIDDPWGNTIGFVDYATRPELSNVITER